jgi:REP element-mobilizing transposase RayT
MTVIAHHLIWTNYGTWLPNDLRGSGSQMVYTPALGDLGEPHFGRRRVQPSRQTVREFYKDATPRLQYPVIRFEQFQFEVIADAFAETIKEHQYTCYACAIMPDHVHLVIRKHKHHGETMIDHFQAESRLRFSSVNAVPAGHPIWTKGGWNKFLDVPRAVRQRIQYVENNPMKEGLRRQAWPFVVLYDDWPFHKKAK